MNELTKNQLYTVDIEGWSADGAGVCRIDGRAVFVKAAIPGERWVIRILKATNTAVFARGEELLLPSPSRVEPDCPHFGKCGGCVMRHVRYEAELDFKLQRVNDAYRHIGGLDLKADEIIGMNCTDSYRNKAVYAVGSGPVSGFFRPRSHDVIPVERCRIQSESSDRAALAVRDFMAAENIPAYDEASGKGTVRHVFVRSGFSSCEMLITVVAARGFGAKTDALVECLRAAVPEATGIILNINKTRGNTVLAGDFHVLWGSGTMKDTLCGLEFELSPMSFYQVNPVQAEKLYGKALEYAAPDGKGLILDLYCGAGTISLCLARGAEKVIGAEIIPEAVENARENALRNGIDNAEFICADAGEAAQMLAKRGTRPDAVVVDPPRKGLSGDVIDAICTMSPGRVVYVSCDVATQARDLALFAEKGYAAVKATAVDMFPRTQHVETVCLLVLRNPVTHINIDVDVEELVQDNMITNKVLFWDFDGTLIHPNESFLDALGSALETYNYNIEEPKIKAFLRQTCSWYKPEVSYITKTNEKWWAELFGGFDKFFDENLIDGLHRDGITSKFKEYILNAENYTLYCDAKEVLRNCREIGYRNFVLSNNFPELPNVAQELGIGTFFDGYIISSKCGYEKPRKEIFSYALKMANSPISAYMIGDNPVADIQGGNAAGLKTVLVHRPPNMTVEADYFCSQLVDILDILK